MANDAHAPPATEPAPPARSGRSLSIAVKLPLFMGTVIAAVLTLSTWGDYRNRLQEERVDADHRLVQVADEMVASLGRILTRVERQIDLSAHSPAVTGYLAAPADARLALRQRAVDALLEFGAPIQATAIELADSAGRTLLSVGSSAQFVRAADDAALRRAADSVDRPIVGSLRAAGDSEAYPVIEAVRGHGHVTGYLVEWRSLWANPGGGRDVSMLIGTGGRISAGNIRDSVWTTLATRAEPPPVSVAEAQDVVGYDRDGLPMLGLARPVPDTPWAVLVEFPLAVVVAPARQALLRLLWVDLAALAAGLVGAWWLSRRLTTPLEQLSDRAEAVGAGVGPAPAPAATPPARDEIERLGVAFDAMSRRVGEALEARAASEAQYRRLFEAVPLPAYLIDIETLKFVAVNQAAIDHYGYSRDEFLRMSIADIRPPEFAEAVAADVRRVEEQPERRGIWRHWKKDGTLIDVEVVASDVTFGGRRTGLAVVSDITERNLAAAALARSEERYRALIHESPFGIALSTIDGIVFDANPSLVALLGYERTDELVGRPVASFYVDPVQRDRIAAEIQATGAAHADTLQWKRRDGRIITARLTARRVGDPGDADAYVEGFVEDVTERLRLEEQFHQAQRMEAVGRLAGGIAHDFNNLLTIIMTTSEVLLGGNATRDLPRAELDDIYRAAERGAQLTRQLLAFSRRQVLAIHPVSVHRLLGDLESLLRRLVGEDVHLKMVCGTEGDVVRADPTQLEQVLLNLVVNARDAMPDGGQLVIESFPVTVDDATVTERDPMPAGNYVCISVSDSGEGMSPEVRDHAFEPFFTTKGREKGTGLGLATVYGIVKQLGGFVWVESEVGAGTTFKIYLPRAADAVASNGSARPRVSGGTGSETVLIAEDEDVIRSLLVRVLKSKGYTVLSAASGEEALDVARAHGDRIDLLLTDVVMTGMSGPQLAVQLVEEHPETIPLYMSGYTDEAVLKFGVAAGKVAFIQKPFTHQALLGRVRELLDRTVPAPL